jgi:hypothetical protein
MEVSMTTDLLTPTSTLGTERRAAIAVTVAGAALAINGAVLGSRLFFDSRDYSEIASTRLHLVHYLVWTACLVALSQLYPRFAALRGPTGAGISRGVLTLAAVGAALDACSRFTLAFVNPYLASHQPALLDTTPDAVLLVPLLGTGVVAMVGVVALGVLGWRRSVLPPSLAVLLVVGAVAMPVIGPMANVPFGAALAWLGVRWQRTP